MSTPLLTPLRDQVLVELLPDAAPQTGVIAVARLATPISVHARVVALGEDVRDCPPPGTVVVVSRLQGIEVGEALLMLPESAVLAVRP